MKNTDFYAYCRDHRKTETDPNKQQVLTDVYNSIARVRRNQGWREAVC